MTKRAVTLPPRTRTSPKNNLVRHVVLIAFGFLMLYPLLWMLKSSLTPEIDIFSGIGVLPLQATFENYVRGWGISNFPLYFVNTLIVVAGCLLGNLIACALAAYAFARLEFRMRRVFFALMLAGIMLPYHVVAVPQYIMFSAVDLVGDSFAPLIIPKLLATDAFFIFLMIQFLRGIPRELDAAAALDGAGHYRTFWSIILPLMRPALLTTAIFTFIWTWNDFFSPLIYLTNPNSYTVSLGLNALLDSETATGYGPLFAMSVLTLVPVFVFFLLAQKWLVQGIATTGTKG